MDNYFTSEISRIERELIQLKTSNSKSAGVVQTTVQSINVEIPLSLNSSQTAASGTKSFRVITEKNAIIIPTLNWYSENVLIDHHVPREVRAAYIEELESQGDRIITVGAAGTQSGANSDVQKLINGETVLVSVVLTIRATAIFNVEVIDG